MAKTPAILVEGCYRRKIRGTGPRRVEMKRLIQKRLFFFLESLIRRLGGERRHCTVLLLSHICTFTASLLNSITSQDAGKRGDAWGRGHYLSIVLDRALLPPFAALQASLPVLFLLTFITLSYYTFFIH